MPVLDHEPTAAESESTEPLVRSDRDQFVARNGTEREPAVGGHHT